VFGGTDAKWAGNGVPEAEVPLTGVLAEFREALQAEIEAARRTAQSSAVELVHGERIGRVADGHQYLFKLENPQLALADDLPGDLYVPGRQRVDATVISLSGSALTLAVAEDLGQHVPRASLSSNVTNLLRALIARIEAISQEGRDNPAGARLLGEEAVSGAPVADVRNGDLDDDLNDEQGDAVASGLGRDTTFVQGPPGTGKTKTIGALGEQLARAERTVLLVSHTNNAVDQALWHIAEALGPEAAAQGKVLRLGSPKDERVAAQPDLLVKTHVERRSAELVARREELSEERSSHGERVALIEQLLALGDWAAGASERQSDRERRLRDVHATQARLAYVEARVGSEEQRAGHWEPVRHASRVAQARVEERSSLVAAHAQAEQELAASRERRRSAETALRDEADRLREHAHQEGERLVTEATARSDSASDQKDRHAKQLDAARQLLLAVERYERLPSVEFTRAQIEQHRRDVAAAQAALMAAEAAAAGADDLLQQARSANAMTRRLRRLPKPEEQEVVLRGAREEAGRCRGELAASSAELERAEQQLAETERLRAELDGGRELPTVEEVQAALSADDELIAAALVELESARSQAASLGERAERDAREYVREGLSRATAAVDDAARLVDEAAQTLADCDHAIAAFQEEHGRTPAEALALAEEALSRRDALRQERDEVARSLDAAEAELCELLLVECRALGSLGRGLATGGGLNDLQAAVTRAVRAAAEEARGLDTPALRREVVQQNAGIRAIDVEVARIEEQLAAVEATVIADSTVLATTLTKAYLRDEIQRRRFDTVILDEASMAPIPALWVAAAVADHNVVIVGDPNQLPPISQAAEDNNQEAPEYQWLARDVFEVSGVLEGAEHLVKLRTQYRMHPAISAAPNALVYAGELRDDPKTLEDRALDPWYRRDWGHDAPVLLVDTEKADAWCSTVVASGRPSRLNFLSATLAAGLAERLLREEREPPKGGAARIIIATPYRPQARLITLLLRDTGLEGEVVAGTVHSLQGSEAPVVIYDLVLDEPHRRAGLFSPQWDRDARRQFNVGLTRAKHRLLLIGDFRFLAANGKRAFLGQLLNRFDGSPRIDAEHVLPLNLAASAAAAQAMAFGYPAEPTASERVVVTQRDFDDLFVPDLGAAMRRIVIYSPFITHNRLEAVGSHLRAAIDRGVSVYVVTKTLDERKRADVPPYRELTRILQRWGVIVVPKKAMHEKLVFIDEDTVWVGSLNPLSFRDTREIMERRRSRSIADDYRRTLHLDFAFEAFEEGEVSCPICGLEVALAEGDRGTYRRCITPGCYARGLTDPPLRDGKLACSTYGGDLYYGSWGEKPAWRCHKNSKHRMLVHPNHLKLPAMAALLTGRELKRLREGFGLTGNAEPAVGEQRAQTTLFPPAS
jgi:hypothetical protein